jgi:hypothetical protein
MTNQRFFLAVAALVACCAAGPAFGQQLQRVDPVGGSGGAPFEILCPDGYVMAGIALRAGDRVDAVAPVCAQAFNAQQLDQQTRAVAASWAGGPGGTERQLGCPAGYPGVSSIAVQLFRDGRFVDGLSLHCQRVSHDPKTRLGDRFNGVSPQERERIEGPIGETRFDPVTECPPRYVAVGIYGRSGRWLDQLGLVCGFPVVHNPSVTDSVAAGWGQRAAEEPTKPSDLAGPRQGMPQTPKASQLGNSRPGGPR